MRVPLVLSLFIAVALMSGCASTSSSRYKVAEKMLLAGKDKNASKELDLAIKESRDKMQGILTASGIYYRYNRYASSEELIEKILDDPRKAIGRKLKNEEKTPLYELLAEIHNRQGKTREAVTCYEEALKTSPHAPMLQNNLAYQYAEADLNLDRALDLAKSAHKALPDKGIVTDTLGWIYYKLDKYPAAVRTLAVAVKQEPEIADLRYHLGAAYAKSGSKDKAWIEFRKALILDPTSNSARDELRKLNRFK